MQRTELRAVDFVIANQMVAMYIIFFRILGIILIAVDILGIYILFRRRQYF